MAGTVLFDVDGTLLDTNHLHVLAWFRALRENGHQVPMARIHGLVGMGSDTLLDTLLGGRHPHLDEAHSRQYASLRGDVVALPGARDLLVETARRGARVVLATSAKGEEIRSILETLGAGDAIADVVSSADVDRSKPDPDIFLAALERSGGRREATVVVGDTVWDVRAAAAAGLRCVAVTTGGIAAGELEMAGAVAVYESAADLLANLSTSPLAPHLSP